MIFQDCRWALCRRLASLTVGAWVLLGGFSHVYAQPLLRVCIPDVDFPPLTFVEHDGQAQDLIRHAAAAQGWLVKFEPVPVRRCLAGLVSGRYDAATPVAATVSHQTNMAFPLLAGTGTLDERYALSEVVGLVYRAVGTSANWDGHSFSGLHTPVLFYAGTRAVADRLGALQVAGDDSAKGIEQMTKMLLHGRAQLAVGAADDVQRLLQNPQFAKRIEVLPQPFIRAQVFMAVNLHFYAEHRDSIDALWVGIGQLRAAPEWPVRAAALAR
jgi:polar amino acid transport system substrate-binding protein